MENSKRGAAGGRRKFMGQAAALGAAGLASGWVGDALAQGADLAPYKSAKIVWRQAAGESTSFAQRVSSGPLAGFHSSAARGARKARAAQRRGCTVEAPVWGPDTDAANGYELIAMS